VKRGYLPLMCALLLALAAPVCFAQGMADVFKAVVKIRSLVPRDARTADTLGTEREGSGVVIDAKGHILTIGYLIVEAETLEVVGPGGESVEATFVGYDHTTGFGLLRAKQPLGVEPMKLGVSAGLKAGDQVLVGGHGGTEAVQGAYVIKRMEFAASWEYLLENAILTVPAYSHFGGAALIGRDGRLLGIGSLLTQVLVPGVGPTLCNIFVPVDLLHPILNNLMTSGRSGKVPRPWLGISSEETHGRVFINQVTAEGPGERAGLEKDDLVLKVKGEPVNGLADFYRKVWALGDAGVEVPLTVLRGTQMREIKVRSGDRHQFLQLKPGRRT
jgi:S1-C subfamily serine protease